MPRIALTCDPRYHAAMFFTLSKILWTPLEPGNFLLIVLGLGLILSFTRRRGLGRALVGLSALGFLMFATLPVGRLAIQELENRMAAPKVLPERIDGIIVLGGVIDQFVSRDRGQPAVGGAVERLTRFADLARRYPEARLVFTGGSGRLGDQTAKEAEAVAPFLESLGMDKSRIVFEADSRNTFENAEFSRRILMPQPGENWLLITSAFHMPRSVGSFRKAGWPVIPQPVGFMTSGRETLSPMFDLTGGLNSAATALHEWLGLTFYYLTGRTSAFYPAPQSAEEGG